MGQKDFVWGCRESGSIIVSKPQTTSSALLRVFDLQIRDRKPKFTVIYNAEALLRYYLTFRKMPIIAQVISN